MANKPKLSAEYFPHYAAQKKTVSILKAKFGSNGYAFWYQLLEILCAAKGHYLDCSMAGDLDFLAAQTGIPVTEIELILRELLFRGKLDQELWESDKIIWCQNLIDNLSYLYSKRITVPEKPIPSRKCDNRHGNAINVTDKTGRKGKEREVKGSKEKIGDSPTPPKPESKSKRGSPKSEYIEAYREITHLYPDAVQQEAIDRIVGGDQTRSNGSRLTDWKGIVMEWVMSGWNKRNVGAMLDKYAGIPNKPEKAKQGQRVANIADSGQAWEDEING
jgi:hypothetical protein